MAIKHIYILIPVMDEESYLPSTLACAMKETAQVPIKVMVCVNQPDSWWQRADRRAICEANGRTLEYIYATYGKEVYVEDCSSPGRGWNDKKQGVGMARRLLMQRALSTAEDEDVLISMDADTCWQPGYVHTVAQLLSGKAEAVCARYYHPISGMELQDRAMLRYEIYMRTYLINQLRIGSPYAFTALGSVIACTAGAAKKVDGFDTQASGEDFYFLQKLAKSRPVALYSEQVVYPANRVSQRVPYGTGPAIAKNMEGHTEAYPVFSPAYFDEIKQVYDMLPMLKDADAESRYLHFLMQIFKNDNFLSPLRRNSKNISQFIKAFHQKADALREFQYLRWREQQAGESDEVHLQQLLQQYYPMHAGVMPQQGQDMNAMSIAQLNAIRDELCAIEWQMRQECDRRNNYI